MSEYTEIITLLKKIEENTDKLLEIAVSISLKQFNFNKNIKNYISFIQSTSSMNNSLANMSINSDNNDSYDQVSDYSFIIILYWFLFFTEHQETKYKRFI